MAGVHREAALPPFAGRTLEKRARAERPELNEDAPAHGRKAALYATCYGNYNQPAIGVALLKVLARNGVETEVVYPGCCGMPQMEQGDLKAVAAGAARTAAALRLWIDKGYSIVTTVSSCALMLKFEWPLLLPGNDDVRVLSENCFDAAQFVVDIAKKEGLAEGLQPLDGGVTLHVACHARAQNMGVKARRAAAPDPGNETEDPGALFRPWRLMGRDEGEFQDRHEDRQAGHARRRQGRKRIRRLRMPACRPAPPAGHGADRRRRAAGPGAPPDRTVRQGLRVLERFRFTRNRSSHFSLTAAGS